MKAKPWLNVRIVVRWHDAEGVCNVSSDNGLVVSTVLLRSYAAMVVMMCRAPVDLNKFKRSHKI